MIRFILQHLFSLFPALKEAVAAHWYQKILSGFPSEELAFMNYGFANASLSKRIALDSSDEKHRLCIQLYHQLVSEFPIKGKDVLEIGCGYGGGASYIARYLGPKSLTAVDANPHSITEANRIHSARGLRFLPAVCDKLPFENNHFDIVMNVESSHCYSSMKAFVKEAARVLCNDGFFLFCDFRPKKLLPDLKKDLNCSGFRLLREDNITENVANALDSLSAPREHLIASASRYPLRYLVSEFAALKGTGVYRSLKTGEYVYMTYAFQKIGPNESRKL